MKVYDSRKQRRIIRRATKEYSKIVKADPIPSPIIVPQQWNRQGDSFDKFSMFDETQISYTSADTTCDI